MLIQNQFFKRKILRVSLLALLAYSSTSLAVNEADLNKMNDYGMQLAERHEGGKGGGHPAPHLKSHGATPHLKSHGPAPHLKSHGAAPHLKSHGPTPNLKSHGATPNLKSHGATPNFNAHLTTHPAHILKYNQSPHLSNKLTQMNQHHAKGFNQQFQHNPSNAKWVNHVKGYQQFYHQHYYQNNINKFKNYSKYWNNNHFHFWYSNWFQWGFYGGFWFPVTFFSIEEDFYYPIVQWLFVDNPDPEYFNAYYDTQSSSPDACLGAFPYRHIYFPTDTLRDLLVEVSSFPQNLQCNFRNAIINFTSQLQQEITSNFSTNFSFGPDDIVVTYYQNLQNKALMIVGFVSHDNIHMAFEGFLDLVNPDQSISFAPKGQNPTQDELKALDQLNSRIKNLGGNPMQEEPETTNEQGPAASPATQQPQTNAAGPGP